MISMLDGLCFLSGQNLQMYWEFAFPFGDLISEALLFEGIFLKMRYYLPPCPMKIESTGSVTPEVRVQTLK